MPCAVMSFDLGRLRYINVRINAAVVLVLVHFSALVKQLVVQARTILLVQKSLKTVHPS